MNIVEWSQSQFGFYVDRFYQNGKWILEKRPIALADHHKKILSHCFTPDASGRMPYDTVCLCESAKSGKSAIAALVAQYFALHIEPGSEVYLIANKRDQAASKMYKSLTDSIEANKFLPNVDPLRYDVNFSNGTTVKAIPSNARTEAGARYTLAVFDEPWAIIHQDAENLVSEFKPDPTRNVSIRLFVGYGGYEDSQLWRGLLESGKAGEPVPELESIKNSDGEPACFANGTTFVYWSDVPRQPWQNERWLNAMSKLPPAQKARQINCHFVGLDNQFIPEDLWQDCLDPNLKPLEPTKDIELYVGVDCAVSPGGDDTAVIATYQDENNQTCVAWYKQWQGKVRRKELRIDKTVEPFLLRQHEKYNLVYVGYDPRFFTTTANRLKDKGLPMVKVTQSLPVLGPLGQQLFNLIQDSKLSYYDDPELKAAPNGVVAREVPSGLHIKKSSKGKADLMVALSFCAPKVSSRSWWTGRWNGELGPNAGFVTQDGRLIGGRQRGVKITKTENGVTEEYSLKSEEETNPQPKQIKRKRKRKRKQSPSISLYEF